jgi:O-antigen/teichoic acid export membrane protein
MFALLSSIAGDFMGLSVHGGISREYFNKKTLFKEYVFNCLLILGVSSAIIFSLVFALRDPIQALSQFPGNWLWTVLVFALFQFFILSLSAIYQAKMQAGRYSTLQLSQTALNVSLSLVLVMVFSLGWKGRILGQTAAVVLIGGAALAILLKNWSIFRPNKLYIRNALSFGVPLIPHSIGTMLIVMADRFIITNRLGLAETGIYTAGLQIGLLIELIASSFNKAYTPWLIDTLDKKKHSLDIRLVRITYAYIMAISAGALLFGLMAPYFGKYLLGKDFRMSYGVIMWIALGGAFKGMYFMVTNYIFYVYKTYILAWVTFVVGILNIGLTLWLVKIRGIEGAAQSHAVSMLLSFLATWIVAAKVKPMPWREGFLSLKEFLPFSKRNGSS